MPELHAYGHVDRRLFVSLTHSPVALVWLFFRRTRPFVHSRPGRCGLRSRWRRFSYALGLLWQSLYRRYGLGTGPNALLHLPVSGHLVLRRHLAGYKVFDLDRRTVRTCFPEGLPPEAVERQIAIARMVGRCAWAPDFLRAEVQERWFEEAYINGSKCRSLVAADGRAEPEVLALLAEIAASTPPRSVSLHDYLRVCAVPVRSLWARLQMAGCERNRVLALRRDVTRVASMVKRTGPKRLSLVFSHGDFCAKNLLRCGGGLVCLDWEFAEHRSLLHDLHRLHYYPLAAHRESRCGREQAQAAAAGVREAAALLERAAWSRAGAACEHPAGTGDARFARGLFFLEILALEAAKPSHDEKQMRLLADYLARWLALFAMLDEMQGASAGVMAAGAN
jgi:hypothetical protein